MTPRHPIRQDERRFVHGDEISLDPFVRHHVGTHGAFTLRTNAEHVDIARAAVAHRLDVPLGSIEIDWDRVKGPPTVQLRRVA